jgi:hypothetical protein
MRIQGIGAGDVWNALAELNTFYDGNIAVKGELRSFYMPRKRMTQVQFQLRAVSSFGKGARTSASGRHMPSVCWHANRDFFRLLFERNENAVIRTGLRPGIVYMGSDHFESRFPRTYYTNVGSEMSPANFGSLCVGICD